MPFHGCRVDKCFRSVAVADRDGSRIDEVPVPVPLLGYEELMCSGPDLNSLRSDESEPDIRPRLNSTTIQIRDDEADSRKWLLIVYIGAGWVVEVGGNGIW